MSKSTGDREIGPTQGGVDTPPTREGSATDPTCDTATAAGVALVEDLDHLPRDTTVGRYTIINVLGTGGMGTVYTAFDPSLNRKVAIKLMRKHYWGAEGQARLLREAQAMAQLSHPNVVGVYDVGTLGELVFLAMELVDGRNMKLWLAVERRSWREVVAVMMDAGRGLAAAHRAGLIHRDFKPANILVDSEGRGRVLDFGVARPRGRGVDEDDSISSAPNDDDTEVSVTGNDPLYQSFTTVGSLVGTPAYMAPEQRKGKADERSDQYAFCITLHEALLRTRPRRDLANTRTLARKAGVPTWVTRVLLRGLSRDPNQRFASMTELLAALGRNPWRRRKQIGALAASALMIFGVARAIAPAGGRPLCQGGQDELAEVWNDEVKGSIRTAFEATKRPYAVDTYERVVVAVDERKAAWAAMHDDSCEATHVRGVQSDKLLDLRTRCLERRRSELQALARVFAKADAEVVDNAVQAVFALPGLDRCADVDAITAIVPLPESPEIRVAVEEIQNVLDRGRALNTAGKFAEGVTLLASLDERVRELDHAPLLGELLYLRGTLLYSAGDLTGASETLRQAMVVAAEARDHETEATSAVDYVFVLGYLQARHAEALAVTPFAESAVARAGNSDQLRGEFFSVLGTLHSSRGKYDEAIEVLERAVVLMEKSKSSDPTVLATGLNNLGMALGEAGRYQEAQEVLQRAVTTWEEAVGPDHPSLAASINNLGTVTEELGKAEEAMPLYRRGLEIREAALGPDHLDVAMSLNNLGVALRERGRFEEARPTLVRALAIFEKALGPKHPNVAAATFNVGRTLADLGKHAEALEHFHRSLELKLAQLGPDHNSVAHTYHGLALAHLRLGRHTEAHAGLDKAQAIWAKNLGAEHTRVGRCHHARGLIFAAQGRCAQARVHYQRAVRIVEASLGPDTPWLGAPLRELGECALEQGRAKRALPFLERALSLHQARGKAPYQLARTRFALARALWSVGAERERALELARQAKGDSSEAGYYQRQLSAKVEVWLRGKRSRK